MPSPLTRPFEGAHHATIVLPRPDLAPDTPTREALSGLLTLIRQEVHEFEVELGAPVRFTDQDPGNGSRVLIGSAALNPALQPPRHTTGRARWTVARS